METTPGDGRAREALRAAERASAAPLVDYPPTPAWYPPMMGVFFAALVALAAYRPSLPITLAVCLAAGAVMTVFWRWYWRKRGTMPTFDGAPPEFRRAFRLYAIGVVVIVAVVVPTTILAPAPVAVGLTFVLVTVGLVAYERVYADAAEHVRLRLS